MQEPKPQQQPRQERRREIVNGVEVQKDAVEVTRETESTSQETKISWSSGNARGEIKAKGFALNSDGTDIETLTKDGFFFVKDRRGEIERRFEVVPGPNGVLKKSYFVRGTRREFDADAQAWLSRILLEFVRTPNSDQAIDLRIERLLQKGGPGNVFEEVSLLSTDSAKVSLFRRLLAKPQLSNAQRAEAVTLAAREIVSESDLAELLIWISTKIDLNETLDSAFFKAAGTLKSDYYHRRVLSATLRNGARHRQTAQMALQSALHLKSDYELAEFLIELAGLRTVDEPLRQQFLAAVAKLRSTYDQDRVLAALQRTGQ